MKIAYFLYNKTLPNIDYNIIMDGNPGLGGSEYEFLLVSLLLERRDNGITPVLLTNSNRRFPHKEWKYVCELEDACQYCVESNISQLVVDIKYFDHCVLSKFEGRLQIIIWAHNNATYPQLDLMGKSDYIRKIVNCGREELEMYRDHLATLKSTYIYNIVPFKGMEHYKSSISDGNNHNVVYMGSITFPKGFHVLAAAWKDVIKNVPDAQLYVIGTGNLYDRNAKLGTFGIAEQSYEDTFLQYLSEDGVLLSSVHFLGLLGNEKFEQLGRCKVGVPNPTGYTETFCITAIEMQLMGCNIATIEHPAYLDTVFNHNYLYKDTKDLSAYIVRRLIDEPDNYEAKYRWLVEKFGIESNIQRWEKLIIDDLLVEPISNNTYQYKHVKNFMLSIKRRVPLLKNFPVIERIVGCYHRRIGRFL